MIAAEVTIDSPDFGHLEPIVTAIETELAAAGVNESVEVVLADASYWHQAQMERIVSRGTVVLVPPEAGKRKGARTGWDGASTRSCGACSRPTMAASSTANTRA